MTGGLLDKLSDPEYMAQVYERHRLIMTLCDRWGCDEHSARAWLESEDQEAMELFAADSKLSKPTAH